MENKNRYLAEVVESSLTSWKGLCWDWEQTPSFGSLVSVTSDKTEIFGIVYAIETGSIDANRTPFAYKKTEEELKAEQPQIFEFLKTTFHCLTLGYRTSQAIQHSLAPKPPKIHGFIGELSLEEIQEFIKEDSYLQLIFGHESLVGNVDELLLAHMSQLKEQNVWDQKKFTSFVHTLSLLTGNDYRRLKLFLQRIQR